MNMINEFSNGFDGEGRQTNNESAEVIEYKVLGQNLFQNPKKIKITPSWVTSGTKFPAELRDTNYAELEVISGLHPLLFDSVRQQISKWYPVQISVLPRLIAESNHIPVFPPRDIVISSPTGSGKTLCYILPIINSLHTFGATFLTAIIMAPVQNLVVQIAKEFGRFNVFNIKCAILCGNRDFSSEKHQVKNAQVLFVTPGRLVEHIVDRNYPLDFSHLRYLVIDEADRMTNDARLEWLGPLENLCKYSNKWASIDDILNGSDLQKILVSATLSQDIEKLHQWQLRNPKLYRTYLCQTEEVKISQCEDTDFIANTAAVPSTIENEIIVCEPKMKPLAIFLEIEKMSEWKKILVFANNKIISYRLTTLLKLLNGGKYQVEEFSSNLFGHRRQKVLKRFLKGTTRVLISSDALSRGISIENIDAVINYDKPRNERLFIHRVGRTGRCGKRGTAVSFITPSEERKFINPKESLLIYIIIINNGILIRVALKDIFMKVGCNAKRESKFTMNREDKLMKKYQSALLELKNFIDKTHKVQTTGKLQNHLISKRKKK